MGLDKQLLVMSLGGVHLDGLTMFYQSVLQSWPTLSFSREWDRSNQWVYDEPLFFNPLISVELFFSDTVRSAMLNVRVS